MKDKPKTSGSGKVKTILILAAVTLFLAGFCAFVYRFVFREKQTGSLPDTMTEQTGSTGNAAAKRESDGTAPEENNPEEKNPEANNPEENNPEETSPVEDIPEENGIEETEIPESTPSYVENLELTVIANGETLPCRFTGNLTSAGKIVGEGHFEFDNEDGSVWTFDGTCIRDNLWTGESVLQPFTFTRNGAAYNAKYTGSLVETVPDGYGILRAHGSDGLDFTYTGQWKNGSYDGYGELDYDNQEILRYHGNFEQGTYRPTFLQLISALCSKKSDGLVLTEQVMNYISENQTAILEHNTDNVYFGSGFNYANYRMDQDNPDGRCFRTSMTVAQIVKYDETAFGFPVTEILAYADGGRSVYYGYYFGDCGELGEGDLISVTAYPIGYVAECKAVNNLDVFRFIAYAVETL